MPTLDAKASRLIVVSNRLPITITSHADSELVDQNSYSFKMSSGGLVSALSGCKKQMTFSWIGWTGLDVPENDKPKIENRLSEEYSCKAVWLSDEVADKH
jgi:trehalose 6-phosphate synthase